MLRRGLVKCSSLFFIVFLMCPRRIHPTAIGKQNYFHAVRRTDDLIDVNLRARPSEGFSVFNQNDGEFIQGIDKEPGFDLSDDEIRKFKLWPKGIIPYYIDAVSFNDKVLRDRIRLFLNTVNTLTRLSFLELPSPPKDHKTRWVFFANRRGQLDCADHSILNFTNEGVQHVNLGYDCLSTGGELAEAVLAIVGVPPQHNSPDRDTYIEIVEKNIMPEKRYLFKKLNDNEWLFHNTEYDIASAGHYHHHKYSINGQATIQYAIQKLAGLSSFKIKKMGQNRAFTTDDILKLRMLYNYIVKKKENKVPECDKLFIKGHNFKEEPFNLPEVQPRKKPNKYLGLPEIKESHSTENEQDESELSDGSQNSGDSKEEDSKYEGLKVEEYAGERIDYGNENYDELATRKMDLKSHPIKSKHESYKIDPLLYLSDYQTDGRRRKASGKNTTLKARNKSSTA